MRPSSLGRIPREGTERWTAAALLYISTRRGHISSGEERKEASYLFIYFIRSWETRGPRRSGD